MDSKPVNPIIAALYGAVVALAIGYGLCFFLLRAGVANVTCPGEVMDYGGPAFARAGLNLCAVQHALLAGGGSLGGAKASAQVILPIITWSIIPIAALFVSGYAAGRLRAGSTGFGIIAPAMVGGILYALALAAMSALFAAPIKSAALPSGGGFEFAPPDFPLHPTFKSTLITAGLFGVIFTYIGSHFAAHETDRRRHISRWWVCGKSILPFALVLELIIAIASQAWLISKTGPKNPEGPAGRAIVKYQPTVAGIAYGLINGASLRGEVISSLGGEKKPFSANLNLYTGMRTHFQGRDTQKQLGGIAYVGLVLMAIIGLTSGALAVRWGSRDGSLPTAIRIAVIHAAYLALTMFICALAWQSTIHAGSIKSSSGVSINLQYNPIMLYSIFGMFVMAFIGAYLTNRLYTSGRRGFPSV
ncbi:MAG: hypothetical protein ABFD83_07370 [Armatimonadota bacterium]